SEPASSAVCTLSLHDALPILPLTAITAWEMLFDRIDIRRPVPGAANAVLIIGGAVGVGSIAIQLVKALTDLTVIATASRPETRAWVESLGADHVVDHSRPPAGPVRALGTHHPASVFPTPATDRHAAPTAGTSGPQGRLGPIDGREASDVKL